MKRKLVTKVCVMAAVCVMTAGAAGCGNKSEKSPQMEIPFAGGEPQSMADNGRGAEETQVSAFETESAVAEEQKDSQLDNSQLDNSQLDDSQLDDSQLEDELQKYRQEREDNIQESNGLVEGGSPDEDNYSFDLSGSFYAGQFDTREVTEAYAAARIYVTDTLKINPDTKMTTYMCVDPRILKIYEDEDKGVAAGYDNSNIFACEYCNGEGVWEYLILVRDGKGSAWRVIHHGNSYREKQ